MSQSPSNCDIKIYPSVKIGEYVFIDPSARIGRLTSIWHQSRILADVIIGENCSIGGGSEIGRGTIVGDNTRISAMVFLPSNSQVGSNVFIAPHVMFCDDKNPRANNPNYKAEPPIIEDYAVIGANATILPGIRIGSHAVIGAGSIITHDVAPNVTIYGEAARPRYLTTLHDDIYATVPESHLASV